MVATGLVELQSREPTFGYEAAGIVKNIGPYVKKFCKGDRVVFVGSGACSTTLNISEALCENIPDGMTLTDASSMPLVFGTAIYSLIHVARLGKGQVRVKTRKESYGDLYANVFISQSVLIHSACGGVGLAAIQVARMQEAEIYATVGSDEKAVYLMNELNIPRDHIFSSRNTTFVNDLMHQTKGRGVDVALNSLSGELLHATWRCIARFGIMVEIGVRDLLDAGKLDMTGFLASRSYCCVNILQISEEKPGLIGT